MRKKVNRDPLRLVIARVTIPFDGGLAVDDGERIIIGFPGELLLCGHIVHIKEDIYGITNAAQRRCEKCGEN